MSKLNETVAEFNYDGLLVDNFPPADVASVKLAAGEYKRGTIITGEAGGNMAALAAAIDPTKATFILCDDVTAEEGEVSFAYRTGHFNALALITNGTYEITAADKEALRKSGFLLSDAI